jgi:pilus assembly protein CpaC
VRRELAKELAGQDVSISLENNTVFLRGTVKDLVCAERAVSITNTLGKTVNLLQVAVPPTDPQVLLKVRFANVDRAASLELGANIISTGAGGMIGTVQTGQFPAPAPASVGGSTSFTLTDALNIFMFRPDLNLAGTIKALESRRLLETLAEPSVPAIDGKTASFLAGGEFPVPVLQGGSVVGSVTIQYREFGVRITFTPRMTPRGTIRLQVAPEVSALDYSNAVVLQGFTIPALSTRRVQTEIELEAGQSFGIAGLLDNRVVESFSKIPGLADIPLLGKLFQSKSKTKNNTELLVLVTPELVRPIPVGQPVPEIRMPLPFLEGGATQAPRTPGMDVTGPVPVKPTNPTIPVEELMRSLKPPDTTAAPAFSPFIVIPNVPAAPSAPLTGPSAAPAQAAPATGSAGG